MKTWAGRVGDAQRSAQGTARTGTGNALHVSKEDRPLGLFLLDARTEVHRWGELLCECGTYAHN